MPPFEKFKSYDQLRLHWKKQVYIYSLTFKYIRGHIFSTPLGLIEKCPDFRGVFFEVKRSG
jgi:hypothetical protein